MLGRREYRILDENKNLVPANFLEWGEWFEKPDNRRVAKTIINRRKGIFVSTVLLGIDHGFYGTPLWFETMIFGSSADGAQWRYPDYRTAKLGHEKAVAIARNARHLRLR